MREVTAEEVYEAMMTNNIKRVNHHHCGGCGHMVFYFRNGTQLYFDRNCDCTNLFTPPRYTSWESAAQWINMQKEPEVRQKIAASFGVIL